MPIWWRTIEELVPEDSPAPGKRVSEARCGENSSDGCSCPRASDKSGVHGSGDLMIREVVSGESGAIPFGGVARLAEDGCRCRTAAGHGFRDPFPLHRGYPTCGLAHQKDPPPRGRGPDDPHFEPTAETARRQ